MNKISITVLCLCLLLSTQIQAKKIALLIGNTAYSRGGLFGPLGDNPINDVSAMARKLKKFGFQVTAFTDANLDKMSIQTHQFINTIKSDDIVLFYYSGHGVHDKHKDENFLIPVGSRIHSEGQIASKGISAHGIMRDLKSSPAAMRIVLLDSCRDYVGNSKGTKGQGFKEMNTPKGSIIGFASLLGTSSFVDPTQSNSVYTAEILTAMDKYQHSPFEQMLKYAGAEVLRAAANRGSTQEPSVRVGSSRLDFCLGGCQRGGNTQALQAQIIALQAKIAGQGAVVTEAAIRSETKGKRIKRYIAYGNGTAKDTVTGLTWMRCVVGQTWTGSGCSGGGDRFKWEDAKKQTANFAGSTQWRIPTIAELRSLVYCSNGKPDYFNPDHVNDKDGFYCKGKDYQKPTWVHEVFFDIPSEEYYGVWTGSPLAAGSSSAWDVDFNHGYDSSNDRSNQRYVRLVRGGQ